MKTSKSTMSIRVGIEPNDRKVIAYDKVEFESIDEAIAFLGSETALKYLNYGHDLTTRARLATEIRQGGPGRKKSSI